VADYINNFKNNHMNLIKNLNWRYATKRFDTEKKLNPADLELLKESIRLSASSYGLQLYKVVIVENEKIKLLLKDASWGQTQITESSHIFVFCNYKKVSERQIDEYLLLKASVQNLEIDALKGYGDFMKNTLLEMSDEQMNSWTAKQSYIALGNLLAACAELKIDACPMEGFEPEKYDKILGLSDKGLNAAVIAAVGYRSREDKTQFDAKIRKSSEILFETI
jgi:nitroreductase